MLYPAELRGQPKAIPTQSLVASTPGDGLQFAEWSAEVPPPANSHSTPEINALFFALGVVCDKTTSEQHC